MHIRVHSPEIGGGSLEIAERRLRAFLRDRGQIFAA